MKEKAKQILSLLFLLLFIPNICLLFLAKEPVLFQYESADAVSDEEPDVINELSAQISEATPLEAAKAQAVLIRTNLRRQASGEAAQKSTSHVSAKVTALAKKAADETKNIVLKYEDEYIDAAYHAVSASATRNGTEVLGEEYAYFTSVNSKWDIPSADYLTITYVSAKELAEKMGADKKNLSAEKFVKKLKVEKRDSAGYVLSVHFNGKSYGGEWLRKVWGLPSACFYLEAKEDTVRILTKGVGHGLGLSQYGAAYLADNGSTYEEILNYYFPKVQIEKE